MESVDPPGRMSQGSSNSVCIIFLCVFQSQMDLCGNFFPDGSYKYKFECVRGEKEAFFGGKHS